MMFYPRQEGWLREIVGLAVIQSLGSLQRLAVHKQPGDLCLFAKHGGGHVFEVVLFNKTRAGLLADVHRLEQAMEIVVDPLRRKAGRRSRLAAQ